MSATADEFLREVVSMAMDGLFDVASDAAIDDGRWSAAFRAAWVEIDALVEHEVSEVRTRLDSEHHARVEAERRLAEAVEVLKEAEWAGDCASASVCPACLEDRPDHAAGCRLARVIGEGR